MRHAFLAQRLRDQPADLLGDGVDLVVRGVVEQPQLGEPGGGRDRVARQRAGLVDGPRGSQVLHDVLAATEGGGGESSAHDLAEGHEIGTYPVDPVPTGLAGPEPGHDLVGDEQGAVARAGVLESLVEPGLGRYDAHVARRGLGDHAGDLTGVRVEGLVHGFEVVVGQDDRVRGLGAGDTGVSGSAKVATPLPADASSESTCP